MSGELNSRQWLTVPLEEVILRIVGGGTPSKSNPEYYQGEIPWMSVKDMSKHVLDDTADHISPEAVENSSTNVIPAGTPIIATRMSLGKIVVANFDSAINQDLKALFLPAEIHRDYLVYWYRSVARSIEQMGTGTTVKGIRLEALKGLDFALPPFAEQKAIADKLDTLLAQVENTKARLERIPQILKRLRQSVLAAAVSGRLTEEWRKNRGASFESWQQTSFKDICREITVGFVGRMANRYEDSGIPFLRSQNVRAFKYSAKNLLYISEEFHKQIFKSRLEPGDLAIVRSGAPGTTCVIPDSLGVANCSDLVIARPSGDLVSEFGCIFMNSEVAQKNVSENQVGVAQQHFNVGSMKKMPIHLPPVVEQTEIVRKVEQLFVRADRIEQQVNIALARVNNLTQSILSKAFRGELTAQWRKNNPELISGHNSAEALLERIEAERDVLSKKAKPKTSGSKKKQVDK